MVHLLPIMIWEQASSSGRNPDQVKFIDSLLG
jgi:hypothetical protein